LAELKRNRKEGKGPRTLAERRALNERLEQEAERVRAQDEAQRITFNGYWPTYLASAQDNPRKSTGSIQKEQSHFEHHISKHLGSLPLRDFTVQAARAFVAALRKEHARTGGTMKPRTVQYIYGTTRQIVDDAFKCGLIPHMAPPAKAVGATLDGVSNRRTRVLSSDELKKILTDLQAEDVHAFRFIHFIACFGCRVSDAYRLTWQNVDLEAGTLVFVNTKNHRPNMLTIPTDRAFGLPSVYEILSEIGPGNPKDPVFTNKAGRPYKEAPSAYKRLVNKHGLNDGQDEYNRICTHTLRHTMATALSNAKAPVATIQAALNWKTPAMALRYAHPDLEEKASALEQAREGMQKKTNGKVVRFPAPKVSNGSN
jgi:integrase